MTGDQIRNQRARLGLSQTQLSRRARVSRYRLCAHETGGAPLTPDETTRVIEALRDYAHQMRQRLAEVSV
jgi:predicted transcriptional regulator